MGRGALLQSAFSSYLDVRIDEVRVDTDALGTFTGERPRTTTALEAAQAKAVAAIAASGSRLGLGSEGTFGPDPTAPVVSTDTELLVLVDAHLGTVVSETVRSSELRFEVVTVGESVALEVLLARLDVPPHHLIVRPVGLTPIEATEQGVLFKAIASPIDVALAIDACIAVSPEDRAHVEHDLRAHCNPTRQIIIRQTADRLARRLAHLCPDCGTPGWGVVDRVRGLPCASCGSDDTATIRAKVLGCPLCAHTMVEPVTGSTSDPQWCHVCNP